MEKAICGKQLQDPIKSKFLLKYGFTDIASHDSLRFNREAFYVDVITGQNEIEDWLRMMSAVECAFDMGMSIRWTLCS